jgi:hypothetical protein
MPGKMVGSDPQPSVRVTRGAGSSQHLASLLQEGRENAIIDAGFGFIWGISFSMTNQDRQMPQKREQVDKTTGRAATEQFDGGDRKVRPREGKSRKVRTYCYHSRRSSRHLGKSATTKPSL